jgi:DNA-binding NarL/FixJ family response regulator
MIKVVLAEDHPVFMLALETLLSTLSDIKVVGKAESIKQLRDLLATEQPDVALIDLNLTDGNVLPELRSLRSGSSRTRLIVLTSSDDSGSASESIAGGVNSYLLKTARPEEIKASIYAVMEGKSLIEESVLNSLREKVTHAPKAIFTGLYPQLTRRESEILEMLYEGKSNTEIADIFVLSLKTIRNHVSNIFNKMGVNSRTAAIVQVRKMLE